MRRKHSRRNSQETISELEEFHKPLSLTRKFANIVKAEDKLKGIKSVAHDEKMLADSGRPNPVDDLPDDKMKPKVEDEKVTNALTHLSNNTKDTKSMYSRVYSVPSDLKGNKRAQKTGQVPSSINIFGSHFPVVKLVNDNTLLLHTSEYGQEGKTTELVNKIKADLPNHFPDFKVIHVHHPDYRHSAKVMRMRNEKGLHNFLTEASEKHPDEEYKTHALEALAHLKSLKKGEYSKPIHAKRTESEGWDGAANEQSRVDKIHNYLSGLGLSPDTGAGKKRDLGANGPTSININSKGDPHDQQLLHEGGHALSTPAGLELDQYQAGIGQPGFKGKIHQSQFRTELKESHGGGMPEETAQHMEGLIARRSGVEPFRSPNRGAGDKSSQERSRNFARDQIKLFDEGITRFDPFTGENELQGTINSYINAKMIGDKDMTEKIRNKLHQHIEAKKKYKASEEYDGEFEESKLAASEDMNNDLGKGSLQSKQKFNPKDLKDGNISDWQQDADPSKRSQITRLEGGGRERALRKLASKTEVRIKDGKKHYLLHRGMEDQEHDLRIDRKSGKTNYHADGGSPINSWTPDYKIASGFSMEQMHGGSSVVDKDKNIHHREPVSAWISEDDMHHYLPQGGVQTHDSKSSENDRGENEYKTEHEVLVRHTQGHHLANRDVVEQQARRNRDTDNKDAAKVPRLRQIKDMKPEAASIERNRRINSRIAPKSNHKTALRNEAKEERNIKEGKPATERVWLNDRRLNDGVPNAGGDKHTELKQNPDLQHEDWKKLAASEVMHSDMHKGELGRAAKGLVLATAMASGVHSMKPESNRAPATEAPQAKEQSIEGTNLDPNIRNRPAYKEARAEFDPSRDPASIAPDPFETKSKILSSISDVESSGGKNIRHKALPQHGLHQGESAFGKYGLTPLLIRETIKKHPDLRKQYGHLSNFKGNLFQEGMRAANKDGKLEDEIASRHYDRLADQFGHDAAHIGYAWLNGVTGTHRAKKRGSDIQNHWHVKKIMEAYNKKRKD